MILRPVRLSDLPAVLALHGQAFPHDGWTIQMFRDELARPAGHRWTLAERPAAGDGGPGARELLGFAGSAVVGDVVDVVSLAVAPEARRQGVGTRLLVDLVADARSTGVERVLLEVAADNEGAVALYARHGFVQISRRARYYPGPAGPATVDALVLELRLW